MVYLIYSILLLLCNILSDVQMISLFISFSKFSILLLLLLLLLHSLTTNLHMYSNCVTLKSRLCSVSFRVCRSCWTNYWFLEQLLSGMFGRWNDDVFWSSELRHRLVLVVYRRFGGGSFLELRDFCIDSPSSTSLQPLKMDAVWFYETLSFHVVSNPGDCSFKPIYMQIMYI
jgi:hypothetical protein